MRSILLRSYFLLVLVSFSTYSQTDSLLQILFSKKAVDSLRIQAGIKVCMIYSSNNPDSCLLLADEVLKLTSGENEKYFPGIKRLKGVAFVNKGDYKKSLGLYFEALRVAEKLDNKKEIASINNNIGVNFWYQNDFLKAKQYYEKALEMRVKLKNQKEIARSFNNLGTVEVELKQYDGALNHYSQSLNIKEALGDNVGVANCLNNIGIVHDRRKDFSKALEYFNKALEIFRKEKDKRGMLVTFSNMAGVYKKTNLFKESYSLAKEALHLANDMGSKEDARVAREILAKAAYEEGLYKEAFDNLMGYVNINDTLLKENNFKAIEEIEKKYQSEKNEKEIKLLANENKLNATEIANNKKEKKYFIGVIILVALIFGLGLVSYKKIRLSNSLLTKQKTVIESQKLLVEEQNKNIVDSINYAKRIQEAMLKEEQHQSMHLPAHFILFKPKDIVSGDFYWVLEKNDHLYITAADCTGHGVPGAFLTMLGTSFLNEINAIDKLLEPAEILNLLREKIVKELSPDGKTKDGMDMSLARLNLKTKELQWAGANNPLWVIRKSKNILDTIAPDKQPVGYSDNMHPFTNNEIQLMEGDIFYLITDGYADQFGGPKGKKFKYKQLKEILLEMLHKPFDEQKNVLNTTIENWKGNLEQVDDILIVGVNV